MPRVPSSLLALLVACLLLVGCAAVEHDPGSAGPARVHAEVSTHGR